MGLISGENDGRIVSAPRPATTKKSAPASASSSTPSEFNKALKEAKTASDKIKSDKDTKGIDTAQEKWNTVGGLEVQEYRRAAVSANPDQAIADLDAKYKSVFRGNGEQTKYFPHPGTPRIPGPSPPMTSGT